MVRVLLVLFITTASVAWANADKAYLGSFGTTQDEEKQREQAILEQIKDRKNMYLIKSLEDFKLMLKLNKKLIEDNDAKLAQCSMRCPRPLGKTKLGGLGENAVLPCPDAGLICFQSYLSPKATDPEEFLLELDDKQDRKELVSQAIEQVQKLDRQQMELAACQSRCSDGSLERRPDKKPFEPNQDYPGSKVIDRPGRQF